MTSFEVFGSFVYIRLRHPGRSWLGNEQYLQESAKRHEPSLVPPPLNPRILFVFYERANYLFCLSSSKATIKRLVTRIEDAQAEDEGTYPDVCPA